MRQYSLTVFRVTDLRPTDTADSPYYYTFKVQCTSCRETHANWVGVSRHVSRPYAVFLSCKFGPTKFGWMS